MKLIIISLLLCPVGLWAQPDQPVEQWTGKTILLVGGHPDDDHQSHGTLAMLKDHGNEVYILTLTTGNVGTKDPDLSRNELSIIRRQEQLDAMQALGLSAEHYINLGYDDGRVEFADREEVVGKIVYHIRKLKPQVLMAFDPGYNYQVWQKSDHRAAAYLAADAARAAEWRLLYEGQIIHDGLEAHVVEEYLFYGGNIDDKNTKVDITEYTDQRIAAGMKYVSQWSSGWSDYKGPDLSKYPDGEEAKLRNRVSRRIVVENGKSYERFRHYKGAPDGLGHSKRD